MPVHGTHDSAKDDKRSQKPSHNHPVMRGTKDNQSPQMSNPPKLRRSLSLSRIPLSKSLRERYERQLFEEWRRQRLAGMFAEWV